MLGGELKREEACDDPTTTSLQNSNQLLALSSTSITRTQLPSYYNYRTDRRLKSKKIRLPFLLGFVLINNVPDPTSRDKQLDQL